MFCHWGNARLWTRWTGGDPHVAAPAQQPHSGLLVRFGCPPPSRAGALPLAAQQH